MATEHDYREAKDYEHELDDLYEKDAKEAKASEFYEDLADARDDVVKLADEAFKLDNGGAVADTLRKAWRLLCSACEDASSEGL